MPIVRCCRAAPELIRTNFRIVRRTPAELACNNYFLDADSRGTGEGTQWRGPFRLGVGLKKQYKCLNFFKKFSKFLARRNRSGEKDPSPSHNTQSRSEEEMNSHCAGSMGLGGHGRPRSTKRRTQAGWQGTQGEARGTVVGT